MMSELKPGLAPGSTPDASALAEVNPDQVQQWLSDGAAVLIDVREPDEHNREHIAGAHLLPLSSFNVAQAAALARGAERVVFHCKGGKRSDDACRLTAALASPQRPVLSLSGGIEAWKAAGLPVKADQSAPALSVMRQVQLTIGAGVLTGCVLGWTVHPAFSGLAAFFGAGLLFAGTTGTCGLAALLARMPWNKAPTLAPRTPVPVAKSSCSGSCGCACDSH